MHCANCDKEVAAVVTLSDSGHGMVRQCQICSSPLEHIDAATPRGPKPAPQPAAQPESRPESARRQPAKKTDPASFDVIKEAKKRRRYLVKEIRRLKKELKAAETEEAQLTRLLDAADGKTSAKVKLIRAS